MPRPPRLRPPVRRARAAAGRAHAAARPKDKRENKREGPAARAPGPGVLRRNEVGKPQRE